MSCTGSRGDRRLTRVGPHAIRLTHLDRIYWPADRALQQPALTNRDLLRYLAEVSPFMLPHIEDRPLAMIRMPDGIGGQRFFQKHWNRERPRELRRHLPHSMPLSGLRISAEADRVVVREGAQRWQAESGQYLLAFGGDPASGSLTVMEQPRPAGPDAEGYIDRGVDLDEAGRLREAEATYRAGIADCGPDPVLLFDLGVLLEDLWRREEAVDAYEAALRADPRFADGHYNLALVFESLGRSREAIRHSVPQADQEELGQVRARRPGGLADS